VTGAIKLSQKPEMRIEAENEFEKYLFYTRSVALDSQDLN
jgi:hypothetical protein